jgi:putative flippase GtrA
MLAQIVRYTITGGFVTAFGAAIYWVLATFLGIAPLVANLAAYLVMVSLGYVMHSRWSFRGHGDRRNPARTTLRFFLVSLVSLALNSLFVWLLTGLLAGPKWWPVLTMLFVTPVIVFALNRQWVFGGGSESSTDQIRSRQD